MGPFPENVRGKWAPELKDPPAGIQGGALDTPLLTCMVEAQDLLIYE